jgi:hypothetical protein
MLNKEVSAMVSTMRFAALGIFTTVLITDTVRAQAPHVGDVQRLKVITVSMQVGSTEKESKQVTYSPPPGWYVRSHTVSIRKAGKSSFSVTTVPQNWNWLSEDKISESYKLLLELAAKAKDPGLHAKFTQERDAMLGELRKVRASHHALVVDVTARGEGLFRGGGSIDLMVIAEIVYVGTDEELGQTVKQHHAKLK